MKNRYLVFINPTYYPSPGMYGCKARLKTVDEVINFILRFKAEDSDNGVYFDHIQFYDVVEDTAYSVDADVLRDSNSIEYSESEEDLWL